MPFFLAANILLTPEFIARVLGEFEHNNFIWQPVSLPRQTKIFWMGSFDCVKTCISESLNRFPHTLAVFASFRSAPPTKNEEFDESLTCREDIDYARHAKRQGKFGFLSSAHMPVFMRRVRKERLVEFGMKYAWREKYALIGKPVRVAPFEYEFGTEPCQFSFFMRNVIRFD